MYNYGDLLDLGRLTYVNLDDNEQETKANEKGEEETTDDPSLLSRRCVNQTF